MLSYCLECRKNTESKNSEVVRNKNGRIMLLSKCVGCNSKNSKFLKQQKARELISNLTGVKIPILSESRLIKAFFKKV